jgi:hypothetical protein
MVAVWVGGLVAMVSGLPVLPPLPVLRVPELAALLLPEVLAIR